MTNFAHLTLITLFISLSFCYREDVNKIPGQPSSTVGVGHTGSGKGGPLNIFGTDYGSATNSEPWLTVCSRCGGKSLCQFDSDGDGWTNGEELGDPCCTWRVGNAKRTALSHPAVASSVPSSSSRTNCSSSSSSSSSTSTTTASGSIVFAATAKKKVNLKTVAAVVAFALLALVILVGSLINACRRTPAGAYLRYHVLGSYWSSSAPTWLRSIDVLGLMDFFPELARFTLDRLLFMVVVAFGIGFTAALNYESNKGRSSKKAVLGLALGDAAEWCFALALLPITRNSIWTPTLGCSFERAIFVHRLFGRVAVLATAAHGALFFSLGYSLYDRISTRTLYGSLALLLVVILLLLTTGPIRRRAFELFYYLHVPLSIGLLTVGAIHAPTLGYKLIVPAILWVADLVVRCYRGRLRTATIIARDIVTDETGVEVLRLDIHVSEGWEMEPGGYVFLNHPKTSAFTWHPFSPIATSGNGARRPDVFSLFIQNSQGRHGTSYSSAIARHAAVGDSVHVDGPYGRPAIPVGDCAALLVAGGIGITPMLSLAEHLHDIKVPFHLVWTVRSQAILDALTPAINSITSPSRTNVCVHLTRAGKPQSVCLVVQSKPTHPSSSSTPSTSSTSSSSSFTDINIAAPTAPAGTTTAPKQRFAVREGRPDIERLVPLAREHIANGHDLAVYACGPQDLVIAAGNAAKANDAFFHSETFLF